MIQQIINQITEHFNHPIYTSENLKEALKVMFIEYPLMILSALAGGLAVFIIFVVFMKIAFNITLKEMLDKAKKILK